MSTSRPSTRGRAAQTKPADKPKIPLQFTPFREDHFKTSDGIAAVNLQIQQMVNAINEGNGTGGRVVLPSGLDVKGATVTGLGDPQHATDAVSNAHVSTTYGYGAQRAQLDIGGEHALKGLTWAVGTIKQLQNAQPAQYDGTVNYFTIGGWLVQWGNTAVLPDAVFVTETFPTPYPNVCFGVVAIQSNDNGANNRPMAAVVLSNTQFKIEATGSGAEAFWIAVGW